MSWQVGLCWICHCTDQWVHWIGHVSTPSGDGDVYACGLCMRRLDRNVQQQRDSAPTVPPGNCAGYSPAGLGPPEW